MRQIGVLQARTDFSAIIAEVERSGEEVTVTRHGRPAVRIVPVSPPSDDLVRRRAIIEDIKRMRADLEGRDLPSYDLDDLRDLDRFDRWS